MEKPWGEFCEVYGINPRNRILEFMLVMKGVDFTIGDIAKETDLNRATTYNIFEELLKGNYVKPTRKVSAGQLYILNTEKEEVKILMKAFNLVLDKILKEYQEINKKEKKKVYA